MSASGHCAALMPTVHAKKRKPVKKKHKAAPKRHCKTVTKKVHGKKKRVKVCTPVKKKKVVRKPAPTPTGYKPTAPAFPPSTPIDPGAGPSPNPPADPSGSWTPPPAVPMTARQAERLLWRAGFGPKPGDVARVAAMGLDAAIAELVHPVGEATLVGPAPHDGDGGALQPYDLYGHDHLWWLDRMVRSDQPLVERMALVWHDWFACNRDKVQIDLLLGQNALFRRSALGSFANLLRDVTVDPAMLAFLDGIDNRKGSPNENYAREVMELFTLGADRGAYTETDIRQAAKALTGWRRRLRRRCRPGQLPLRRDAPRQHDQDDLRHVGQLLVAGRLQPLPAEPAAPVVLRDQVVVLLRAGRARRPDAGHVAGGLRQLRLSGRAGAGADLPPSRLPRRAGDGQAAGGRQRRAAARARAAHRHRRVGLPQR